MSTVTRLDLALAGAGIITAFILLAAAGNRSAEAYSLSMQASCAATVTAAAVIELAGATCAPDAGHAESVVELCRITHGRSAKQVALLPQCRESER
jgi:hypothetical protein